MISVQISTAFETKIDSALLEKAAQTALSMCASDPEADLSVVVADDAMLQQLNSQYLGIDAPTDVLSFPSGEELTDPETDRLYLGDIIVSYPRAAEQAAATDESITDELQLLVVHGVLHLLGHDHAEADEKEQMWNAQAAVLTALDVKITRLPE